MLLLSAIIMSIILSFSDEMINSASKDTAESVVRLNANELEYDDGELETDDINFYEDGVYIVLYTESGTIIEGTYPNGYTEEVQLISNELTEVTSQDGTRYYVYDYLSPVEDLKTMIWVRGIMPVDDLTNYFGVIAKSALFILPVFIILTASGCYLIAKKTFRPLDQIVATAENIRRSEDLSLRINLQSGSTEVVRLSNAFDNLFKRLEQSFITEKQFSQNISHELRTPTAVILAQCEYALSDCADLEDKEEALEVVQKQANKMSKLTSDLLQLVRMEQGIDKMETSLVDLSELITIVCEEKETIIPKTMFIETYITDNITIIGNQTMLIRLVTNLINNAIRYGKENGTVKVYLEKLNDEVILKVEDNGIGIDNKHLDKIWNRFYQVDSARTANTSASMGLGLSMVAEIVKAHGAKVSVQSVLNQGSVFTVKFNN